MKRAAAFFLLFIIVVSLVSCSKESDEDRIRQIVADIQTAGERKDIRAFMRPISKGYHDPRGFDHEGIRVLVLSYFLRYPKISVYIGHSSINVEGGTAKARLHVILTSGDKTKGLSSIVPQSLGVWDFDITLQKEGKDWKVIRAVWKEAEYLIPDD